MRILTVFSGIVFVVLIGAFCLALNHIAWRWESEQEVSPMLEMQEIKHHEDC